MRYRDTPPNNLTLIEKLKYTKTLAIAYTALSLGCAGLNIYFANIHQMTGCVFTLFGIFVLVSVASFFGI